MCVSCVYVQNVYVNISRITAVGKRLLEGGHYAAMQIQQLSAQLEREWKAFASALDERSAMLEMSASFHQKADQVVQKYTLRDVWLISAPFTYAGLTGTFLRD